MLTSHRLFISAVLLYIVAAGAALGIENQKAMARCGATDASREECLLRVYGR